MLNSRQFKIMLRMKSIIKFLKKYDALWVSPIGLLIAALAGYFVYYWLGCNPLAYIFGTAAFAIVSVLIYFSWGYDETDPAALGSYTGTVFGYWLISIAIFWGSFSMSSVPVTVTSGVICALMGVYLTVPILKFFQANDW